MKYGNKFNTLGSGRGLTTSSDLEERVEKLEKIILTLYQGDSESKQIFEEIRPLVDRYIESKSKEELLKIIK